MTAVVVVIGLPFRLMPLRRAGFGWAGSTVGGEGAAEGGNEHGSDSEVQANQREAVAGTHAVPGQRATQRDEQHHWCGDQPGASRVGGPPFERFDQAPAGQCRDQCGSDGESGWHRGGVLHCAEPGRVQVHAAGIAGAR